MEGNRSTDSCAGPQTGRGLREVREDSPKNFRDLYHLGDTLVNHQRVRFIGCARRGGDLAFIPPPRSRKVNGQLDCWLRWGEH